MALLVCKIYIVLLAAVVVFLHQLQMESLACVGLKDLMALLDGCMEPSPSFFLGQL